MFHMLDGLLSPWNNFSFTEGLTNTTKSNNADTEKENLQKYFLTIMILNHSVWTIHDLKL
jgi:hypothetical protein